MSSSPPGSPSAEIWLKKAIDQLKSGIPFFVTYLGKVELPSSIAEERDPDNRVLIVCGCLRKVAKAAGIEDETLEISEVAEAFLGNANVVIKNVEVQLSVYDNVFTIGEHIKNRFHGRHKIEDIAFAHIDPERKDIIGYYALERKAGKPDTRYYYVIQSECSIQVLAAMKLAFTVFAELKDSGDVNVNKIAENMTPSPTTPSGAYCLLRLSTPAEDGTGFVHQITPIDSDKLHQQVKIMALNNRTESQILQSEKVNPPTSTSIQNITNIYLNMDDLRRMNPYGTNQIFPELLTEVIGVPESLQPKKASVIELVEEDEGLGKDERPVAKAPPLAKKTPQVLARMRSVAEEVPPKNTQDDKPVVPALMPKVRETPDSEIEKLKQKEKEIQEKIRHYEATREVSPASPPLPPRRKRKVAFKSLKQSFQVRAQKLGFPLKKKLGNLRLVDLEENTMGSDYTSLNSQSFDGSVSSPSSETGSEDSGVQEELFVWPEAPENSLHWTHRLFRKKEKKLPLSSSQFATLSEYLDEQPWFHGTVHRSLAESRLVKDGEFFVRQSSFQPGQFIVTALRNRTPHHICLINREGQIRSHAGEFSSVMHLIQFHFSTQTPLCSKTTAVLLKNPVRRPQFFPKRLTY